MGLSSLSSRLTQSAERKTTPATLGGKTIDLEVSRNTPQLTTGVAPVVLMMCIALRIPLDVINDRTDSQNNQSMEEIRAHVSYKQEIHNPDVTASAYTTQDATVLTSIAFIADFTLKCGNGAKGIPLYAEIDGKTVPAARTGDDKYQVSWTEEVKKARSGDYNVNLFDDEGYAALRKAVRSGEDASTVKPLVTVVVNYPGAYQGPWVNSEFMAAVLSLLVCRPLYLPSALAQITLSTASTTPKFMFSELSVMRIFNTMVSRSEASQKLATQPVCATCLKELLNCLML
uniref:Translocon-associated protein subunit delta n=1 Tax=Timema cristinae TaxID=61476 RepID=A0A7R9CC84_TIMCR|nr:unnamed protein product [Timema cristinae]